MSGVNPFFGVVGRPPTADACVAASSRLGWRGRPVILHQSADAIFGGYATSVRGPRFLRSATSFTIADGFVDQLPSYSSSALSDVQGLERVLAPELRDSEPTGLSAIAGAFAVAHYDFASKSLRLTKDAFAGRPLYYAHRDGRFGFATDPEVLIDLGIVDGSLDAVEIARFLMVRPSSPKQTAFKNLHRLVGGHYLHVDGSGARAQKRWYFPERTPRSAKSMTTAAAELRKILADCVTSYARNGPIALMLSSGKDSGVLAVALRDAGVSALCITYRTNNPKGLDEFDAARRLARSLGHDWEGLNVPARPTRAELMDLATQCGTPVTSAGTQWVLALRQFLRGRGIATVLDGHAGDMLFSSAPVSAWDVLRREGARSAIEYGRLARSYGVHGPGVLVRAATRAVMPTWALRVRDAIRPMPPWVVRPPGFQRRWNDPDFSGRLWQAGPRTDREDLVEGLSVWGASTEGDLAARLFDPLDVRMVSPMLDPRATEFALSLPSELRAPLGSYKPLLDQLIPETLRGSRYKGSHLEDWIGWVDAQVAALNEVVTRDSLIGKYGYIHPGRLRSRSGVEYLLSYRSAVALEAWLAREGESRPHE